MYGCKLKRHDLDRLWELCAKDASANASLSAEMKDGISEYSQDKLNTLLDELDNPPRLPELTITVNDGQRRISISVERTEVAVNVAGPDETWVRGRAAEIKSALRKSQTFIRLNPIAGGALPALLALIAMYSILFATASDFISVGQLAVVIFGTLTVGGALAMAVVRQVANTISLSDAARPPWTRTDKISVAILAVAVITVGIIAFQTWG